MPTNMNDDKTLIKPLISHSLLTPLSHAALAAAWFFCERLMHEAQSSN